ncbi:hypothetical protein C8Q79DRAFT_903489, partial [Trametes meyenii]
SPSAAPMRSWLHYGASILVFSVGILLNRKIRKVPTGISSGWGEEFTYLEADFPPTLVPLSQHTRNAALVVEDTVHYPPNDTAEWSSLFPAGSGGFVQLGPHGRLFGVSMFHQLHCLDKMRRAIVAPPDSEWESSHTQHCLNYVRQMLLCASSVRLEPVKEADDERGSGGGLKVDGLGLEHRCRDWSLLREKVEENFHDWIHV